MGTIETIFNRDGACFDVYLFRREIDTFNPPGVGKQLGKVVIEFINRKHYIGLRDSDTGSWIFNASVTEHMVLQHNDQPVIGRGTSWLLGFTLPTANPQKYFIFAFDTVKDAQEFRYAFAKAQDFEKNRVIPAASPVPEQEDELLEVDIVPYGAEVYGDPTVLTDSESD